MISTSSLLSQTNPFEDTIQQLVALEQLDRLRLQAEQSQLNTKKSTLSEVGSRLSTFSTTLKSFQDSTNEQLQPLAGTSSNTDAVSIISTAGLQNSGNFSFEVTQLAKQDIALSGVLSSSGTELSATGSGSFDITIGSGDPISISVDTTGLSNQEALQAIADEIDTQLGDQVASSAFNTDGNNSQLSIKSLNTGSENRISIGNVQGDFSSLGLSNVFTSDQLDAQFTIDSISFERSDNLIDDVIDGFTFELNETTTSQETITVDLDTEAAVSNVETFIEQFNNINSYIRAQSIIDTETDRNGILADERGIRNLSIDMRILAVEQVSSLSGEDISSLTDIGIALSEDGTMSIDDSERLENALKTNANLVNQLFSNSDGVAAKLESKIDLFITGEDNVLDTLEAGLDQRIERFDDRIEAENDRLDDYEAQLRAEFVALDLLINESEFQFSQVLQFQNQLLLNSTFQQ